MNQKLILSAILLYVYVATGIAILCVTLAGLIWVSSICAAERNLQTVEGGWVLENCALTVHI